MQREDRSVRWTPVSAEFSRQEHLQVEGSRAPRGECGGQKREGPEVRLRMKSGWREGTIRSWSSNPDPNS